MAADVKTMKAKAVNGQSLDVKVTDGAVTVDNAKVVEDRRVRQQRRHSRH